MTARRIITFLAASWMAVVAAQDYTPVITSFSPNGDLTWTNAVIGGEYDVEWTSSLLRPWYDNWESITGIVASDTTVTVNVPMSVSWTSGGPYGRHVNSLGLAQTNPDIIYAATETGVFKTVEAGDNWVRIGSHTGAIAVDPTESRTVFAGEGREYQRDVYVYRSTSGGASWSGTALFHLDETIRIGVSDIWIDPTDPSTILAGVRGVTDYVGLDGGGVYKSTDGGETWGRSPLSLHICSVTTLASDPKDPQTVYYGTTGYGYVFQSTEAGSSWTRISPGGEWVYGVRDIEVDSNSHVYAATSEGLWKYAGGWAKLTGLPTDDITALAIDTSTSPGVVYAGTAGGVFASEDGGETWMPFMDGLGGLSVTTLAFSGIEPKTLHAGTAEGGVWSRPIKDQATRAIFYRVARVPEFIAPVITLQGTSLIALEVGTEYIEPGLSATDNIDGDITEWVVVTGFVDHTVPGTYTLRYNVSDSCGNPAVERTRTVNVVDNGASPPGMRHVPAGSFQMGDNYGEGGTDDVPVHVVEIDAFYIDRYHVTKALWDEVYTWAVANEYSFDDPGSGKRADHPVHTINWYDAVKWCNARSEKEGLTPVYYTSSAKEIVYRSGRLDLSNDCVRWGANGYRLPTEAEWEKAARGGLTGHHFPWESEGGGYADHIDGSKANYADSGDAYEAGEEPWTTPVGYYDGGQTPPGGQDMANGYGLYDMAGNVYDWCWDRYQEDWYSQPGATENDTRGPDARKLRVGRGGCWRHSQAYSTLWVLRCAARDYGEPEGALDMVGFRCVRSQ